MIWGAIIILFLVVLWESGRVSKSLQNFAKYGDNVIGKHEEAINELRKELEEQKKRNKAEFVSIANSLEKIDPEVWNKK